MSPRRTLSTTARVFAQLKHDHRTIGLILFVPSLLIVLLRYVFNDADRAFDTMAPMILGIFPFTVMFIVTSITMLRERTAGTLERLMTMPMGKLDLIFGYALAFSILALLQASIASAVTLGWLGVEVEGGVAGLLTVAVLAGVSGQALGLFLSAFAHTEFQAVQFMPAFVAPQILMCGLFAPRDAMHEVLQWIASVMPLTYIVDAMKLVTTTSNWPHDLVKDLVIVGVFAVVALVLGAATLRRQS
jgi:ABC-2 type transport system permease protein